jgi:hypothetical protein
MKVNSDLKTLVAFAGFAMASGTANAASLITDFQTTISSEQNANATGEGRFYHVSVNSSNSGTGWYAADLANSGTDGPAGSRLYTEDVVSYSFVGGTNNNINGISRQGGTSTISWATTDTAFDGFAQDQGKLWTTTDPGTDIASSIGATAAADFSISGHRSLGGAAATFDITGLATGSVNLYYGAFGSKPTVTAVMTGAGQPDLFLGNSLISSADAHLNGDSANRSEYYLAEMDFVTDGLYDTIVVTWDSDGDGDLATGNGRGVGTVLTGTALPIPEPSTTAFLGLAGLALIIRRRK